MNKKQIIYSAFCLLFYLLICNSVLAQQKPCARQSEDYKEYMKVDRYRVDTNTPIRYLTIAFHIFQNDEGENNFQNDSTDLHALAIWVEQINEIYASGEPTDPILAPEDELPNYDSRIRFTLGEEGAERIYFYQNTDLNNKDLGYNYGKVKRYLNENYPGHLQSDIIPVVVVQNNVDRGFTTSLASYHNINTEHAVVIQDFYRKYADNGLAQVYWDASLLAHELAHVLGLVHTYSGGGASVQNRKNNDEYLEDVFGPFPGTAPHNSDWYCDAMASSADICTNNLMSGNSAAKYISPRQAALMHRALAMSSIRKYVIDEPYVYQSRILEKDEYWDFAMRLYHNKIVVPKDIKLRVACDIALPCQSEIEVSGELTLEPGATFSTFHCSSKPSLRINLNGGTLHVNDTTFANQTDLSITVNRHSKLYIDDQQLEKLKIKIAKRQQLHVNDKLYKVDKNDSFLKRLFKRKNNE